MGVRVLGTGLKNDFNVVCLEGEDVVEHSKAVTLTPALCK